MASIETYRTRIDALKTSVETLKGGGPLIIKNLPGRAPLTIDEWGDLNLPYGTVIAGNGTHVYLRAPHGGIYWESSSDNANAGERGSYSLGEFYRHLHERAANGEQFRIIYQPSA